MIIIKTKEEIEILKEGGKILHGIIHKVADKIVSGVSEKELDDYAFSLIKEAGGFPAFLRYKPPGAQTPYPASLCVSVNDEVVHGIPSEHKILKEGDIVSIDLGLKYKKLFTDMAITVPVGEITPSLSKLLKITKDALYAGIDAAVGGKRVGDIGHAIESFVKPYGYGIVDVLSGHGVGREIHEDPFVPNFGEKGKGEILKPGMVIAIEPMLNIGDKGVKLDKDGHTVKTVDGKASAHFEHTVLITDSDPVILTSSS